MKIKIDRPLLKSLLVMATVIEARDPFTGGHVWRTSRYAQLLAEAIGLTRGDVFLCQLGGLVHDLGKIAIPDAILRKDGRPTDSERAIIQTHPVIGGDLVANHPLGVLVRGPVAEHHLRMDGRGYPEAWCDREPSLITRVVTIADAFDAMTSRRPYRTEQAVDRALDELQAGRNRQFDARLADRFCEIVREGRAEHVIGHCAADRLMLACHECGPIITLPAEAEDGDAVECPACTNEFRLHFDRDAFELEWLQTRSELHTVHPDYEAANEMVDQAPPSVEIDLETS